MPFVLVMLQPDMGTTMSILMAVFFVLVLGGLQMRWVLATAAGIAMAVPLLIMGKAYRATRFLGFLDPYADPQGKGYQIIQAHAGVRFGRSDWASGWDCRARSSSTCRPRTRTSSSRSSARNSVWSAR